MSVGIIFVEKLLNLSFPRCVEKCVNFILTTSKHCQHKSSYSTTKLKILRLFYDHENTCTCNPKWLKVCFHVNSNQSNAVLKAKVKL